MLNGKSGVQLDFSRAPWSEKYFGTLEKTLYEREVEYEVKSTGQGQVVSFMSVDLHDDLASAQELAKTVLREVFGLRRDSQIKLYLNQ